MTIVLHDRYVAGLVEHRAHVLGGAMGVGGYRVDGRDEVYDRCRFRDHHLHQRLRKCSLGSGFSK